MKQQNKNHSNILESIDLLIKLTQKLVVEKTRIILNINFLKNKDM